MQNNKKILFVNRKNYNRFKSYTHTLKQILELENIELLEDTFIYLNKEQININDLRLLPKIKR